MSEQIDGVQVLRNFLAVVQKTRSNLEEAFDIAGISEVARPMLRELNPYIGGSKCPLDIIIEALDKDVVEGMTVYNLMYIAHHLEPTFALMAETLGSPLPKPDASMVTATYVNH